MNRAAHGRSNQASTAELHTEGEAVRFEIVAGKRGNARCRANQTKNGDDFAYANEEPVRRLLQVPFEQQPNMDPEREWFIAGRSMPDTEPVSLLKLRRPDGSGELEPWRTSRRSAIVNSTDPFRQVMQGEHEGQRRYLVIAKRNSDKPGAVVQIQMP